jgi:hypothetical protein
MPYEAKINKIITREVLKKDYEELQSMRKIAEKYGISRETVRYYIHQYGLEYNKLKVYNIDHDFFSRENEQSFYIAGFIAADGCLKKRKNTFELQIGLAKRDKEFLEMIRNTLNAETPVRDFLVKNSKRNPLWNDCWKSEITITSEKIYNDLSKFNIVPRKSLIYTFPLWIINHPLINHYMRGYNDGDGSFFINAKKYRITDQVYVSIRGTQDFLTIYRNILEQKCLLDHREKAIRIDNGIGVLEYGGNGIVSKIAKFLYRDATIFLPRKREIISHLI